MEKIKVNIVRLTYERNGKGKKLKEERPEKAFLSCSQSSDTEGTVVGTVRVAIASSFFFLSESVQKRESDRNLGQRSLDLSRRVCPVRNAASK